MLKILFPVISGKTLLQRLTVINKVNFPSFSGNLVEDIMGAISKADCRTGSNICLETSSSTFGRYTYSFSFFKNLVFPLVLIYFKPSAYLSISFKQLQRTAVLFKSAGILYSFSLYLIYNKNTSAILHSV